MSQSSARSGVTLIELIVVIALLGVVAVVAELSLNAAPALPVASAIDAQVARARGRAVASGRAVTIEVVHDDRAHAITAHPDGSVVADTLLHVDRTSGRGRHASP